MTRYLKKFAVGLALLASPSLAVAGDPYGDWARQQDRAALAGQLDRIEGLRLDSARSLQYSLQALRAQQAQLASQNAQIAQQLESARVGKIARDFKQLFPNGTLWIDANGVLWGDPDG
jgi:hypothetical protein